MILYALGGKRGCIPSVMLAILDYLVGATLSPNDQTELKFLYEGDENFSTIPTFGVIPAQVESVKYAQVNLLFYLTASNK